MSAAPEMIQLEGIYLHARNEIINPAQDIPLTKYFLDKWAPDLGPNLTILILQLRKHCLYNKQEKREAMLSQEQLVNESGLSESTIRRELKTDIARKFVKIIPNYIYNKELRKSVRTSNVYEVALDDPIHPTDEEKFLELKEKRNVLQQVENITNDLTVKLTGITFIIQITLK